MPTPTPDPLNSCTSCTGERCGACPAQVNCVFARLSSEALDQFDHICRTRIVGQGAIVFHQGDEAREIFLLRSGWVKASYLTLDGRATTVDLSGPGTIFGLREILNQSCYEVSVGALVECELESAGKSNFLVFLHKYPHLAVALLTVVSSEMGRLLVDRCEIAAKLPSIDRLLNTLRGLAQSCGLTVGQDTKIKLPLTVTDLAERIGCSRQWTSKMLGELEETKMILRRRGWITLTEKGLAKIPGSLDIFSSPDCDSGHPTPRRQLHDEPPSTALRRFPAFAP